MKKVFVVSLFVLGTTIGYTQQVQDFSLPDVLSDQNVSLSTYPSCQGILIIFTSNACPYDEQYRARIKKLSADYQDRVPVILVNAHTEPAESPANMKKKAQQLELGIPYLADKDQMLMQRLGATKSPQAFLLRNSNGKFSIVYNGAIDDNAQVEGDVRQAYLKDAIDIMLSNQAIKTTEIRPVGCSIRKK
jgi:peroxiredoxin